MSRVGIVRAEGPLVGMLVYVSVLFLGAIGLAALDKDRADDPILVAAQAVLAYATLAVAIVRQFVGARLRKAMISSVDRGRTGTWNDDA
jgi:hypothetical protein